MPKIEELTPRFSCHYLHSLRIFEVFGCFNITPSGIRILGQTCKQLQTLNIGQCHKVRRIYNEIFYSSKVMLFNQTTQVSDFKTLIFKTMLSSKCFTFKSMALHLASLWNRGLRYLRMNSLLHYSLDRDLSCG